ncbi:GNAT family N-acetyltransferase [Aquimarina sp. D1M17]|uniref:GNAT family N-acetyltransferase n=1 Tax=Aquimarina acroporae TaxID=2937283 RepID=UPI0020BF7D25|nr:GNAT family N-acetyltransferase [Aquimarina acroporae]MCK8524229.1 GNAT family N-acetyltransferase [Aquimarina acroporae]
MKNIRYTTTSSKRELEQILQLQKNNLSSSISKEDKEKEGFVTVEHDLELLTKMHTKEPHIIAKDDDKVVGYALSMVREFKEDIEVLEPMFSKIDTQLRNLNTYIVMGQVCIDKNYRKQGIFRGLYNKMKDELNHKYDVLITEVAANNIRSLNAHYAIGFSDLLIYNDNGITWHLVQWDWK